MPTPEQYAEWDAMARAIQGDRPLSELDDGLKAVIVAVRSGGPTAAQSFVDNVAAFSTDLTHVVNGAGESVPLEDLPASQQNYYATVNAQRANDRASAAGALTLANDLHSTIAQVPEPILDPVPPAIPIIGTVSGGAGSDGSMKTTVVSRVPTPIETMAPAPSSSSNSSSSGSRSSSASASIVPAAPATPGTGMMLAVAAVVVLLVLLALGFVRIKGVV